MLSKEYLGAIIILLGSVLKAFGVEIENELIEGVVFGIVSLVIAISRFKKGDINALGVKSS